MYDLIFESGHLHAKIKHTTNIDFEIDGDFVAVNKERQAYKLGKALDSDWI